MIATKEVQLHVGMYPKLKGILFLQGQISDFCSYFFGPHEEITPQQKLCADVICRKIKILRENLVKCFRRDKALGRHLAEELSKGAKIEELKSVFEKFHD